MPTYYNPSEGFAIYTAQAVPTKPTFIVPCIVSTDVPEGETIKIGGAIMYEQSVIGPLCLAGLALHVKLTRADGTLYALGNCLSKPPSEGCPGHVEFSTAGAGAQMLNVLLWWEGDGTYQACELTDTINITEPVENIGTSVNVTVTQPAVGFKVGDLAHATGSLMTDPGSVQIEGMPIDIYQKPSGAGDDQYEYLGTAITGESGFGVGEFSVPFTIPEAGTWYVRARFEGTEPVAGIGYMASEGYAGFSVGADGEEMDLVPILILGALGAAVVIGFAGLR